MKRSALFLAALTGLVCFLLGLVAAGSHSQDGSTPYPLRPEHAPKTPPTVTSGPDRPRTSSLRSALPTSPPGSRTTVRIMYVPGGRSK
jgi:hypothetical protein